MLRLAIFGVGVATRLYHMPALQRRSDVIITAICRKQPMELADLCSVLGCRGYTNFRDLLTNEVPQGLEAVIIATPHPMHCQHANATLATGCHILVEKPLTLRYADAAALVTQAHSQRRLIGCVFSRRLQSRLIRLKQALQSREYGVVRQVTAEVPTDLSWAYQGQPPTGTLRAVLGEHAVSFRRDDNLAGAGILADIGIHYVDAILWLTGLTPISVSAWTTPAGAVREVGATVSMTLDNGIVASLSVYGAANMFPGIVEPRITFYLEAATATVYPDRVVIVSGTHVNEWSDDKEPPAPVDNFVEAICYGATLACSGQDALTGVAVLEAAYRSARAGGEMISCTEIVRNPYT